MWANSNKFDMHEKCYIKNFTFYYYGSVFFLRGSGATLIYLINNWLYYSALLSFTICPGKVEANIENNGK